MSSCGKESSDITDADGSMPVAGRVDAGIRTQEWVENLSTVGAVMGPGIQAVRSHSRRQS